MKTLLRPVLLAASVSLALASCARQEKEVGPSLPVRITVIGLNDFHGALEERTVQIFTSGGTSASVRVGGGALLAAYVEKVRAQNPAGTILLSAGDMWQGSLESNFFEGRPVVLLDNHMGVDAAAVGNHEFDYGPNGAVSLADPAQPPAQRYGALETRRAEMKFPLLGANVRATEEGVPTFPGFTVVKRKGISIGIVGVATEDTPNVTQRPNVAGLAFDPPAEAIVRAAAQAREQGAEIVIGVGHIGGACKRGTSPEDAGGCEENHEVMRVLKALPRGTIDAFVAGHTHQYMSHVVNGVPVIESGAYGSAIGRIEIEYDREKKRVVKRTVAPPLHVCRDVLADTGDCAFPADRSKVRPVVVPASFNSGPIEPSAEVQRLLAPFRQEVAEMKAEVLGKVERRLEVKRHEPSDVGAFVTEAMLAATKRHDDVPDARVAFQNSGGLRKAIEPGPLTYGALYEVLPFDNLLVTATLSGERLERMLTDVLKTGRVFQQTGLLVELRCAKPGTAPDSVKLFDPSGKPIGAKENVTIVFNDFLANGGDGTKEALSGVDIAFHPQYVLRDVVAESLRTRKTPINSAKDPALDPKKPRLRLASGCKDPRPASH